MATPKIHILSQFNDHKINMKNLSLVLVALLVVTFTHACSGTTEQADTTATETTTTDSTWTEEVPVDSTVSDSTVTVADTTAAAGN